MKVFGCGADHVILDLEDGSPGPRRTSPARWSSEALKLARSLRRLHSGQRLRHRVLLWRRSRGGWSRARRHRSCRWSRAASRSSPSTGCWAARARRGLPPGGIDIIPIIETGKAVANARAVAAAGTRVNRMAFGAGDYTLDMNMDWTLAESQLEHARTEMAVTSRAAGLEAPIDTVWVHINDLEGLRARQTGQGRSASRARCASTRRRSSASIARSRRPSRRSPLRARRCRLSRGRARVPRCRSSSTGTSSTTRSSTRRNACSTPSVPSKSSRSISSRCHPQRREQGYRMRPSSSSRPEREARERRDLSR